jgi:hypothetical protein
MRPTGAALGREKMNCAEFQRDLPFIIDEGGNAEQEQHLKECKVCADLVNDLRFIAEQAKLLVPMKDPSEKVWNGIQDSLEREGLVKPRQAKRGLLGFQS